MDENTEEKIRDYCSQGNCHHRAQNKTAICYMYKDSLSTPTILPTCKMKSTRNVSHDGQKRGNMNCGYNIVDGIFTRFKFSQTDGDGQIWIHSLSNVEPSANNKDSLTIDVIISCYQFSSVNLFTISVVHNN